MTAATTVAALEKQESLGLVGNGDGFGRVVDFGGERKEHDLGSGDDGATITAPLLSTSVGIDWSSEDGVWPLPRRRRSTRKRILARPHRCSDEPSTARIEA